MQVINVKHSSESNKKTKSKVKLLGITILIAMLCLGLFLIFNNVNSEHNHSSPHSDVSSLNNNLTSPTKKGVLKTFSGEQFKALYNNFAYPNTSRINERTPITGDESADEVIRKVAVERGYQLRSAPVSDTFQNVGQDYKLQRRAAQPWLDMKAAAEKDGIKLGLTAAYRSADDQRQIFVQRLAQTGIPVQGIAGGYYNNQISQVLRTTAIPGYSRHHTGYTVDISCENQPGVSFEYTNCFQWLKTDNYKNAKTYGWIPSYPEGTDEQGPDPESWEYVWVGKDILTE